MGKLRDRLRKIEYEDRGDKRSLTLHFDADEQGRSENMLVPGGIIDVEARDETASTHLETQSVSGCSKTTSFGHSEKYCNLDPFNHGTATIEYEPVDSKTFGKLARILKAGWDIATLESIEQVCEAEKNSNNYQVHTHKGRSHLLKASHITNLRVQGLVNECLIYLRKNSVHAPRLIQTSGKRTYYHRNIPKNSTFPHKSGIYCLHAFVDGEHFDGSKVELIATAQQLGYLHPVLERYPRWKHVRLHRHGHSEHDSRIIGVIADQLLFKGVQNKFDQYVLDHLSYIKDRSEEISMANMASLPKQIIHYDVHAHNLLFNRDTKALLAFIDFDSILVSQRIRDVGFMLHRLARTCGAQTERKQDVGVDIRTRAELGLEAYLRVNLLSIEEIKKLPLVIQDEALFRVLDILNDHYIKGITTWDFDLEKQVTTLEEGTWFKFG